MIVTIRRLTEDQLKDRDYRDAFEIEIEGRRLSFSDGEPEDATIARDFNDVKRIPSLLKIAYEAGRRNEKFVIMEQYFDVDNY